MKNAIDIIWEMSLYLGLKCQGSDAREIYKLLENEGYISEKGKESTMEKMYLKSDSEDFVNRERALISDGWQKSGPLCPMMIDGDTFMVQKMLRLIE